jgi:twitching motility protein PilT
MDIISLLHIAKAKGASDLHLVVSSPPILRVNGSLEPIDHIPPLTQDDMGEFFQQITSEEDRENFRRRPELDFSYTAPDIGRLRCNVARQLGTLTFVIRLLPIAIPTIKELGLPGVCADLVLKPRGLIIISGPTGSGKSTTLAAMISYLNTMSGIESRRVVTIEDPIEYVYFNQNCTITQRELGSDTLSFSEALRHVLRQDPDLILIGEMRDTETAAAALTIAETGHLVLTTGHASSASGAVERIIDLFPPHERDLAQARLASVLLGVLCQALIPKLDVAGRVAAVEVMLANSAIRNLIREGKIFQLSNTIRTHVRDGMQLRDQELVRLYRSGQISQENLFAFCTEPDEVQRLLNSTANRLTTIKSQY